jgi:transcription elongation GreA/GreB family factor
MSVAFTKETDQEVFEDLADKPLSPHRNLVTADGLAAIDGEVERLQHELDRFHVKAQDEQEPEERLAAARVARDLRYWTARRSSAELVPPVEDFETVHFGNKVTLRRDDGREQTFRIVGEDEADPAKGLISYVSPLARALIGKAVGDAVDVAQSEVEVTAIA